jgi:hypothetical protein
MKYTKSVETIYTTTDYDGFIFTDWNRNVSNARVVKMVESIKQVGWLPEPVMVNEKFEVIDGQSRVKALEKLGMPVQFCIRKGVGRKECQALNLFQKNWSTMDFIDSYVADGNDNYIWLKAMLKQYKRLTSSVVFSLAVSGGRGSAIGASDYFKTLESGDLKVSTEERKSADDALFYLSRFVDTATYLGGRKDKLYSAIMFMYLLDGVNAERLCANINKARYDGMVPSSTIEGYLQQFEIIYNKGLEKPNRIDFMHEYKKAA